MSRGKLIQIVVGLSLLLMVTIFIAYITIKANKETEVIISDDSVEITGLFGTTFNLSDVTSIELKNDIPKEISKTNGSGLGDVRKGEFVLEEIGECRLYTMVKEGPFIYITVNDEIIIINFKDSSKTNSLYQTLISARQ